jgi:hypothetical protein
MSDPMNLDQAADGLFDATREYLRRNVAPIVERVIALEKAGPVQGERGIQGELGAKGDPGEKGDPGTQGERGEKGDKGDRGDAGEAGAQGEKGDRGEPGEPGAPGQPGEKGVPGEAGPQGERGEVGALGEKGEKGEPGRDVDMAAVAELVLASLPDLIAKAVEPLVDKAMARIRVEAFEAIDKAIKAIPKPERGEKGEPGEPGRDGLEGVPGRDALHIDILPAIDPDKVYRRGAWAAHKGGLWHSFEKTSGMRGWECVIDGFQGADIDYGEDVRTCSVKLLSSSGAMAEKTFQLPSIVHRGVWKQQPYTAGDTVMKDGHLWIADGSPDAADEPGTSKMWQLAVRRGRDGKSDIRAAALSPVRLS